MLFFSVTELNIQAPVENRKTQPPPVNNQIIPDELLVSLTSTVCNRSTVGHTAHQRRPDAVWHHPLGRKKYKYFLEQPTSLTGAGRSAKPTVYIQQCIVATMKFIQTFTPSGRLEVVQLMRMMDDMLEKAGVDQQSEELTELSQLVHVEQNIYNIVFHEVIRQVSVGCAERGQLLAKLRLRYQSLLDRIPRHLKALHTEAVAQRALDRRLTEEICLIKTSIQQLSMYVGQGQAAGAKEPNVTKCSLSSGVCAHLSVVQGYHELYELQRARLEAQLVQMTEERDCWKQLTFCVAFKLSAFMSQLKETENAQYEQTSAIQQGIAEWLTFCITHNK
uniref:Uncharacterized protein n=1 Tax=Monopterus albus TaxID=43700 RepID=A0A3Q3K7I5_MONAL